MKKRITLMTAVFALLAILALPNGMKGQTKDTQTVSYGWETTDDADPWTISEAIVAAAGEGNTGSYAGKINTNSTTVQFNDKVYVTSFSYAFKRTSNNNNYSVYIETSTDGSNWSIKDTQAMNTFTNGSYRTVTKEFDGTQELYVRFRCNNTTAVRYVDDVTITYATSAAQLDPCDLALTNASTSLVFDLYNNADAQVINYTTSSTGEVTVSESDYITTVVDQTNKTITVTPIAVTDGAKVITVNQAADDNYATGSKTFTINITDSTPFSGGDVTFDATIDKDYDNTTQGEGSITKNGVTFSCNNGILGNGSEYRLYKNSITAFSVSEGTITQIVFTCTSGNPASGFAEQTGWTTNGNNGTWTGNSNAVSFTASGAQVRATQIVVTVDMGSTPDPTITAENVSIEYNTTSGAIEYTINNAVDGGTLTAATESDWLTVGTVGETVPFTCTANTEGTQRTATVTLTYTYNGNTVTKDVTVTQGAAPVTYTTIPELFAAATDTETAVTVSFGSWIVTGVSINGKNVFVTDGTHGFVIFNNDGGLGDTYQANNVIEGITTATLVLYNGFAELKDVDATNLTITSSEAPAFADVAMADLSGINTGALLHYENLTCSVSNNKYYLSDGTTTLQVYNALYAFEALEDGKTYNITGVYQQYNKTKEILPRSAADIVEVEVQHEEYTLTVSNLVNVNTYIFDTADESEMLLEGEGTVQIYDGTVVMVSVDVADGFVIESLVVDGENVTSQMDETSAYTFTMPTHDVTITATATEYVAPSEKYVRISALEQLTDGCKVIIAARYNETSANAYSAMQNTTSGKPTGVAFTSETSGNNEVLPASIINELSTYCWTVNVTDDGYTFTNTNDQKIGYTSGTNFATGGENILWTVVQATSDQTALVGEYTGYTITNKNVNTRAFAFNGSAFGAYATTNMNASGYNFFLDFFVEINETPTETYTLEVPGYEAGSSGGYRLIASPVNVDPATVTGMILTGEEAQNYDLYSFDENQEDEWQNYKASPFNLVPGKGYLYAKQATDPDQVFQFELTGTPYNDEPITLSYHEGGDFPGWNLVGNPFGETAYIDRDFYVMKGDGTEIITGEGNEIAPMQGFFVITETNGEELDIRTEQFNTTGAKIIVNVSQNRGNVIDRAVVRVENGSRLPKLMLNPSNTKLYIPQDGEQFAVVRSERAGRLPIVFKPSEDGEYSFSVNTENTTMWYLHLIDHETGQDIDLLRNPNYSFFAKTNNKPNRFELEYKTGLKQFMERPTMSKEESFGYYSNGEIIINGEGTLQVFDVNGRLIKNETINGDARVQVKAASGIYMMQLITNDSVKTQKVVVE